jgi:Ternary complex associated domain 9
MSISLDVKVDSPEVVKLNKSQKLNDICSNHLRSPSDSNVQNLTSLISIWNGIDQDGIGIEDPFDRLIQPEEIANQKLKGSFGGIHGDLNLNNILYPKEEKVGFLIDFSESELEGLAAFDLAWLESLIWNFYLFPNLIELAKYSSSSSSTIDAEKICELLQIALEAMNCCAYPADFFIAKTQNPDRHTSKQLLTKICNTLTIASEVRQYFTRKTSISFQGNDVHYALAMSFLRQSSFTIESPNPAHQSELTSILSYLCSAHYLKATTLYLKMSDVSLIVAATV